MATDKDLTAADERVEAARRELKEALTARRAVLDRRKTSSRCTVTIQRKNLLDVPVSWLDISTRARNTLKTAGCNTLADAARITQRELLDTNCCCGEGTLAEIEAMLAGYGLSLKNKVN